MPEWYFKLVQEDLNLCILHMFEGTLLLDTAHILKKQIPLSHITTINCSEIEGDFGRQQVRDFFFLIFSRHFGMVFHVKCAL